MERATILLRRGALILTLAAISACASPPPPDSEHPEAATIRGWVTTGSFQ